MAGWFDMPTWGMMAANPTQPLTQEDLMVGRTDLPPPSAPAPMPPQVDPQELEKERIKQYLQWKRTERLANAMDSERRHYAPEDYGYGNYLETQNYLYG
jgi:hypothetical protein